MVFGLGVGGADKEITGLYIPLLVPLGYIDRRQRDASRRE